MRQDKKCLYVASGESAHEARKFLDYGDLITLNRALELFDSVHLSIIGTEQKLIELKNHWHRPDRVLTLFNTPTVYGPHEKMQPAVIEFSQDKVKTHSLPAFIAAGGLIGRGAGGLQVISDLGYTHVWLFGHDGGHSRIPEFGAVGKRGYDRGRICTAETAKRLPIKYAFWPDPAP